MNKKLLSCFFCFSVSAYAFAGPSFTLLPNSGINGSGGNSPADSNMVLYANGKQAWPLLIKSGGVGQKFDPSKLWFSYKVIGGNGESGYVKIGGKGAAIYVSETPNNYPLGTYQYPPNAMMLNHVNDSKAVSLGLTKTGASTLVSSQQVYVAVPPIVGNASSVSFTVCASDVGNDCSEPRTIHLVGKPVFVAKDFKFSQSPVLSHLPLCYDKFACPKSPSEYNYKVPAQAQAVSTIAFEGISIAEPQRPVNIMMPHEITFGSMSGKQSALWFRFPGENGAPCHGGRCYSYAESWQDLVADEKNNKDTANKILCTYRQVQMLWYHVYLKQNKHQSGGVSLSFLAAGYTRLHDASVFFNIPASAPMPTTPYVYRYQISAPYADAYNACESSSSLVEDSKTPANELSFYAWGYDIFGNPFGSPESPGERTLQIQFSTKADPNNGIEILPVKPTPPPSLR